MSISNNGKIFIMCNPLLDITLNVDKTVIDNYNLTENSAILASEEHEKLIEETQKNKHPKYTLGGSGQNTARVIQWLSDNPFLVSYTGCIGRDENGEIMVKESEKCSIQSLYSYSSKPSGVCLRLITGSNRTLVAKLAASCDYKIEHLDEIWKFVQQASIFYCTSYFSCFDSSLKVAKHAYETNKLFCYNLSSVLICQLNQKLQLKILPYVDVLFGNKDEFDAFARLNNIKYESLGDLVLKISMFPKLNSQRSRKVIITCAEKPCIFYDGLQLHKIPTISVLNEEIIDSNGCGDGFVGGLLYHLSENGNFIDGIKIGHYVGSMVLKQVGVSISLDNKPTKNAIKSIIN